MVLILLLFTSPWQYKWLCGQSVKPVYYIFHTHMDNKIPGHLNMEIYLTNFACSNSYLLTQTPRQSCILPTSKLAEDEEDNMDISSLIVMNFEMRFGRTTSTWPPVWKPPTPSLVQIIFSSDRHWAGSKLPWTRVLIYSTVLSNCCTIRL